MPSVGILTLLVIAGAAMCVRARAAGPAAAFAAMAVLFFVSTPVGSVVPGLVAKVLAVLDSVASPALNHDTTVSVGVDQ